MRDLDPIVCAPMQATLLKERGKVEELDRYVGTHGQ